MKNEASKVIRIEAEPTREDANRIIAQRCETTRNYVREKLAEYRLAQPICNLCYGFFPTRAENPYRDIINMANYISGALLDGWYFFFETERLHRELAELKGRTIEIVDAELIANTAAAIDELTQEVTANNNTTNYDKRDR